MLKNYIHFEKCQKLLHMLDKVVNKKPANVCGFLKKMIKRIQIPDYNPICTNDTIVRHTSLNRFVPYCFVSMV